MLRPAPPRLSSPPRRAPLLGALGVAALVAAAALSPTRPVSAAPPDDDRRFEKIYVLDFQGDIEPALSAYVTRSLEAAKSDGADCIILRIESPGGRVDSSIDIADAVLALPKTIHTIAWVKKYAYSGASMATLACDEIVMSSNAAIGDCQPILQTGEGFAPAGEKIETVLRAHFRRYATNNGWDPLLCEKFVSKDKEVILVRERADPAQEHFVDGDEFVSARDRDLVGGVRKSEVERVRVVVGKDRLLTLTATEARQFGFVWRTFETEEELLAAVSAPGAIVTNVAMSWKESASRWLLEFTGILGALIVVCLFITLFQGVGLSTIIGAVALALLVLVTVTADIENGFSFLLIAVGLLLIAAEVLWIPGFGVAGVLGIACTAAGFLFLATGFTGEQQGALSWDTAARFVGQFALTLLVGGALLVFASRLLPSLPFARRHLLLSADGLGAGAVVVAGDAMPKVGAVGEAATALRPAGRAVVDGLSYDVTSEGGFVEPGTKVAVVRVEGSRVVVRAAESPRANSKPVGGST